MEPKHKSLITSNYVNLTNDLNPNVEFIASLRQSRVLSPQMAEEIEETHGRGSKVSKLLTLIPKRGPNAFEGFINALLVSGHDSLAGLLDPQKVQAYYKEQELLNNPNIHQETDPKSPDPSSGGGDTRNESVQNEALLPIKIQHVTEKEVESKRGEVAGCYDLRRNPRGRCVILNNVNFYTMKDRKGSDLDATNLEELFKKLHFVVEVWSNVNGEEAKNNIMKEAKHSAHESADAFIFIALSHGTKGNIYATDGQKLNIEEDIVKSFSGDVCPALAGKPKIFLIQACQGLSETTGVPEADDDDPKVNALSKAIEELSVKDEFDSKTVVSESLVHEMGDIVIAYATVPGFKSWRIPDLGSWFMREFVNTCCEAAHKSHLLDILTAVSGRVSKKQVQFAGYKQVTRTDVRMSKNFYFFPGYYRT